MGTTGTMMKDAMRALLVITLVMFNFAHAPASAAVGYDAQLTPYLLPSAAAFVDCGDADEDGDLAHAPCHACRIGGAADLPPAPVCALELSRASEPLFYSTGIARVATTVLPHTGEPRAPPAA